jgi:hypothetical protein
MKNLRVLKQQTEKNHHHPNNSLCVVVFRRQRREKATGGFRVLQNERRICILIFKWILFSLWARVWEKDGDGKISIVLWTTTHREVYSLRR